MDKVQRLIEIASQLGSIQDFCEFVDTIHTIAKCNDSQCPIQTFLGKLKGVVLDENVSYDDRRNFFVKVCLQNINLFWSMYKLQQKDKENIAKINHLINFQENVTKKDKNEVLLGQLVVQKQEVQKQIDNLLEKIYNE